jgi:hypothetical protein
MGIKSINEPDAVSRTTMLTPASLNEPPEPPKPPAIESLDPAECTIGDESFQLYVHGTGFSTVSVIHFAGKDEPTTLEADGSLSTLINMDLWLGPDVVDVIIKNGPLVSAPAEFTFHAAPEADSEEHKHKRRHSRRRRS